MEVRNIDAMELVALGDHLDQVRSESTPKSLVLGMYDTSFSFAFQHLI